MHLSGVLAVVAAGLFRGRHAPKMVSAEMRILARSAWNILVFLLNSLVFILIGLQLQGIVGRLGNYGAGELALTSFAVCAVAIVVRFLVVYPAAIVPGLAGERVAPPRGHLFIVSWCGMRGIVSLAAALALPLETFDGEGFPYRDLVIFLTFVVIFVTLVGQGLTLAPVIRRLGLGSEEGQKADLVRARSDMGRAALAAIDHTSTRRASRRRWRRGCAPSLPRRSRSTPLPGPPCRRRRRRRARCASPRSAPSARNLSASGSRTTSATTCCTIWRKSWTTRNPGCEERKNQGQSPIFTS